ncbi:hypothetical protein D3C73_990150 [compost metagenome]
MNEADVISYISKGLIVALHTMRTLLIFLEPPQYLGLHFTFPARYIAAAGDAVNLPENRSGFTPQPVMLLWFQGGQAFLQWVPLYPAQQHIHLLFSGGPACSEINRL